MNNAENQHGKSTRKGIALLFKESPATIKIATIFAIVLSCLNLVAGAYPNCVLCYLTAKWILKGYGLVRWFITVSAILSVAIVCFIGTSPTPGYVIGNCIANVVACITMLAILLESSAREYFKTKGREYADNYRTPKK